ncbi:MAG: hypothetical protein WBD40_23930 [Tepidisphaeraceae bacterium]
MDHEQVVDEQHGGKRGERYEKVAPLAPRRLVDSRQRRRREEAHRRRR